MTAERHAVELEVGALPGAVALCCSGRTVREMQPQCAPGHLLPIIEALLSAQTDEAARRRLGLSPRTFSRRVAELLDHLNVATRFQGGAELARRSCQDYWRRAGGPARGPLVTREAGIRTRYGPG